jgi:hypothetical protein
MVLGISSTPVIEKRRCQSFWAFDAAFSAKTRVFRVGTAPALTPRMPQRHRNQRGESVMHSTEEINAVVNKAKQQRAEYIASKVQGGVLPVALAALVSLALIGLAGEPSQDQAQTNPVVEVSTHNG